ncbi:MAG: methyltransferase domain-containing protein [Anaerolineae bacterium]|nr:methyltransferase domain-containing protein [Anaerolineae bacterium]MCI0608466.1 methyltransferase domain-containing protein [Anaerolineae bacterium]
MSRFTDFTDQQYLKTDQYRDSSNLDARAEIHRRFSINTYGWFNWLFDRLLKLPENARILELGCGPAYLWKECSSRIPVDWNITLSDLSSGMLDAAWRNLVVTGRAFQFKEIDAQSIPFGDETFDAVIANHMLYHVPDRPKAIEEIQRVLKRNGHLFATTVGENHLKELAVWFREVNDAFESFGNPFTLENGLEQLKRFFSQVTVSRIPDNLHVTEVEPIMAYIRSSMHATEVSEEKLVKLQHDLEKELKEKGRIFISKDSGLFEAIM